MEEASRRLGQRKEKKEGEIERIKRTQTALAGLLEGWRETGAKEWGWPLEAKNCLQLVASKDVAISIIGP